ncbi:MAG: alpha/beta hydrolase [Tepidibacter sp.]|jgi:pimeloyl-ACP methyl ester carboxylesterase|uniref:alpha/beta fold hydrolase n=1 Tax=Tepidibacter sp. TaxID=2529387 RepID=UPI0025F2F132|nr:alpha/beta hydrolase [Tepidibacter sp.]MCT4507876.1 alpha/beta hydrolase [Tepidibacter sp.]
MSYFLTDDNNKIYYEIEGKGKPIIFIHGWTCNHEFFRKQVCELSKNYKVITYDLRGHGISEIPENGLTMERLARDLRNLIDYLKLEDVVVAGWSMGTTIILEYIRQFSCDKLDKVCFIDMTPKVIADSNWNMGLFGEFTHQDNLNHIANAAGDWPKLIENFVPSLFATSGCRLKADMDWVYDQVRKNTPHVVVDCWISMSNKDYRAELSKIKVPCLVTRGEESAFCTLETVNYMEKEISDAKVINYPKCGHILFMEEPEIFNNDFIEFVK